MGAPPPGGFPWVPSATHSESNKKGTGLAAATLLEEIEKLAAQRGLSLEEVIGARVKKGRAKATPKYRNPKDAAQTWSGRGKHPGWVKEALAGGKKLEDLAI